MSSDCETLVHHRVTPNHRRLLLKISCALDADAAVHRTYLPAGIFLSKSKLWRCEPYGSMLAIPFSHSAVDLLASGHMAGIVLVDFSSGAWQLLELQELSVGPAPRGAQQWQLYGWSANGLLVLIQRTLQGGQEATPAAQHASLISGCLQQVTAAGSVLRSCNINHTVSQILERGDQGGLSPDGSTLVLTEPHSNLFWVCALGSGTADWSRAGSGHHQWGALAWEPSSERLLLCSRGQDVLVRMKSGRCRLQSLRHPVGAGALWTAQGIAVAVGGSLFLYTVTSGGRLVLLHTLQLEPGSSILRAGMAATWDGRYITACVSHPSTAHMMPCSLAFVGWEAGSLQQRAVSFEVSRSSQVHIMWGADGTALRLCIRTILQDRAKRVILLVRPV